MMFFTLAGEHMAPCIVDSSPSTPSQLGRGDVRWMFVGHLSAYSRFSWRECPRDMWFLVICGVYMLILFLNSIHPFCIHPFCIHPFCIHPFCIHPFCIHPFCIHPFCIHPFCIHPFCIHPFCLPVNSCSTFHPSFIGWLSGTKTPHIFEANKASIRA